VSPIVLVDQVKYLFVFDATMSRDSRPLARKRQPEEGQPKYQQLVPQLLSFPFATTGQLGTESEPQLLTEKESQLREVEVGIFGQARSCEAHDPTSEGQACNTTPQPASSSSSCSANASASEGRGQAKCQGQGQRAGEDEGQGQGQDLCSWAAGTGEGSLCYAHSSASSVADRCSSYQQQGIAAASNAPSSHCG
jgi:hypothetical protein